MPLKIHYISFPGLGIGEMKINTNIIEIGNFRIPWYGLIIMTGIVCAFLYVWFRFKESGMNTDDVVDLALFVVPFGVLGARLYYIIFRLDYYVVTTNDSFFENLADSLGRMVAVWNGGLAIYGGIIAGGIAGVLVARHKKIKILTILDFLAPGVMLAQAMGRWGNFFNAEAHGGQTDIFLRMGIRLETSLNTYYYHPTFLYESIWCFGLFCFLSWMDRSHRKFSGQIVCLYGILYSVERFFVEGLRTDSLMIGPLRQAQVISLTLIAGCALLYWILCRRENRKQI